MSCDSFSPQVLLQSEHKLCCADLPLASWLTTHITFGTGKGHPAPQAATSQFGPLSWQTDSNTQTAKRTAQNYTTTLKHGKIITGISLTGNACCLQISISRLIWKKVYLNIVWEKNSQKHVTISLNTKSSMPQGRQCLQSHRKSQRRNMRREGWKRRWKSKTKEEKLRKGHGRTEAILTVESLFLIKYVYTKRLMSHCEGIKHPPAI